MFPIEENVARIRAELAEAAIRAGRDPREILLLAATKMNDKEAIARAIRAGVDACGENRVQELLDKLPQGAYDGAPVHFIGHLQKNKAKFLVGQVDLIQSVDSQDLMKLIDRLAAERGVKQDILLEVNIGGEAAKSGFSPATVSDACAMAVEFPHLSVRGLMTIPPIAVTPAENSRFFAEMQQLFVDIQAKKYDNASMEILSMGMSGDFAEAIRFGSTMVRVGTAIFGARHYA